MPEMPLAYLSAAVLAARLQQRQRLHSGHRGEFFYGRKRQVALAPLQAAHVGAMHFQLVGKVFLAQPFCFAVSAQVLANVPVELAGHVGPNALA